MTEEQCVNCSLNLAGIQSYSLEQEEIYTVIQKSVAPQQISKDNFICHNCWEVVSSSLVTPKEEPEENINEEYAKKSRNTLHCVHCGRFLRRKRYHLLRTNTEKEECIRNVIIKWLQPREVSSLSRICHPCYLKASRALLKPASLPEAVSTTNHKRAANSLPKTTSDTKIILPSYSRAANTEKRCFFPGCKSGERLIVPTSLRVRLFCDFSFYVPQKCRICHYHLYSNSWDLLNNVENRINTFTAEFVEDYTMLLRNHMGSNIDFEDIEDSDDHLVYYWLGITKEKFFLILGKYPEIRDTHRGATGLAAYLTKLKTGDSDVRLSSLFKTPRSTLERLMKIVKNMLPKDFDPKKL